ncbi:hypothetical protein DCAR_0728734 [Daucus carota subsp. sativus]|uniref:RING-type domain-containing protein n=1 Tax=Daucus carota subsp. sativus TaxID=79200 RepID=A0A164TTC7_DAUCS|nr:PREDICTED: E3 ubiquitin-protein ligase ATL4-like [Daucus carota subsp. sativus]WOH09278.1 hypothetical protein DCAR_0728734 [Daucus carota subsp. sativus]
MSTPPPPLLPFINPNQQINLLSTTNPPPYSSPLSSSSTSTSIIIVIIIIASAIIISASLYLLLRFLSRRFHSTATPPPIFHRPNPSFRTPKTHATSSLPLFTFNSLPAKISGGDCAVCLSKFEPNDQLRLLPLCCHAFHAECIDTWLVSNLTCPLCRSTVHPSQSDALDKILPDRTNRSNSFRVEIGSVSRRRSDDEVSGDAVRSYTIGSFEYVVDEEFEVPIGDARTHRRDVSDKDFTGIEVTVPVAPGDEVATEVAGERGSWLRDYVDRIASVSSRSFRSSGRFFGGSSRRSNAVVVDDLEANNRFGEEISELFQWLSRV